MDELSRLRIADISCGSGAFLTETFDQLYPVYQQAQARLAELDQPWLFDIDSRILQQNLYGIDLNAEAVEICRLSLWIKTARVGQVLTTLDHTIRVGNSVIGDPNVHHLWFDWRLELPEVHEAGGFDVVVGNPPYVRQEWIAEFKPYLRQQYAAYDGAADLYVYFFERGLKLLKPGGRLGFVVTNKWMKAGYGEPLRRYLGEKAWVESVVDFGHAKQIFPDADVFPSILVARRPCGMEPPETARVCAIPREQLRIDDLGQQIVAEGFEVPRSRLRGEAWTLEPPAVAGLLEKIRGAGVPLKEFAGCGPMYGIKTGFNEAFIVDTPTRNRLVAEHPDSAPLLRQYLRGQDVRRWRSKWAGDWMIFTRRGIDIDQFPAIKKHLERFRAGLEPKPRDYIGGTWAGRKPGPYKWYEIQDPVDYWQEFEKPKVMYQDIAWEPRFTFDRTGIFANNTVYFLPTDDLWVPAVLNSPAAWWYAWRGAQHGKDEALRFFGDFMEGFPIPQPDAIQRANVEERVTNLLRLTHEQEGGIAIILDWLKVEFGIQKPTQRLMDAAGLDADGFLAEVKKARKKLTVAEVGTLRKTYAEAVEPLRDRAATMAALEREVAGLVNTAYGLTAEDVALMWKTAPPRMPGASPK